MPVRSFFDGFRASVLTQSSLERLDAPQPQSRFDELRFRMYVFVGDDAPGFVENDWIGLTRAIGAAARLRVAVPCRRCVITTLAQGELPKDTEILGVLTFHNRVQAGAAGVFPRAGVYAMAGAPGTIRMGEHMALT